MAQVSPYGKRVIGEEAAKRNRELVKSGANVYGKRVVDASYQPPKPKTKAEKEAAAAAAAPKLATNPDDPYAGIVFASANAERVARQSVAAAAFAGKQGTGENGAFRLSDVQKLIPKPAKPEEAPPHASVEDVKAALAANPSVASELRAAEMARLEGPRPEALRLLDEAEAPATDPPAEL